MNNMTITDGLLAEIEADSKSALMLYMSHPLDPEITSALVRHIRQLESTQGDRILDTHLGSGSSAIAAHYAGFDFVGIELDQDYYSAAARRFDSETSQITLSL